MNQLLNWAEQNKHHTMFIFTYLSSMTDPQSNKLKQQTRTLPLHQLHIIRNTVSLTNNYWAMFLRHLSSLKKNAFLFWVPWLHFLFFNLLWTYDTNREKCKNPKWTAEQFSQSEQCVNNTQIKNENITAP